LLQAQTYIENNLRFVPDLSTFNEQYQDK
jgi:hypothetical protein